MLDNLRKFIVNFENGFAERINLPQNYQRVENIVVAGMGGSAIAAQILKDGLFLKIPLEISRNYTLPYFANQETLLICVSYSGNTRETLNQFEQGIKRKCKIIAITSGGKLKNEAEKSGIPLIEVPTGFLPRESLPFLLSGLIKITGSLKLTMDSFSFKILKKNKEKIEKEAKIFAPKIKRVFPIICSQYPSVSFRWESQLAENSKKLSESKSLPELSHNEIESWQSLNKKYSLIFLRDEKEIKEIKVLIESIKKIVKKEVKILEVYGKGENKLERILYLILFGDFTSYFLAKENKVNPRETKYIKMMKAEIKKLS